MFSGFGACLFWGLWELFSAVLLNSFSKVGIIVWVSDFCFVRPLDFAFRLGWFL